jgi:hypothetical protein
VGYEELIRRYSVSALPHHVKSFIKSEKGRRKTIIDGHKKTEMYPSQYDPGEDLGAQLTFALKYEGVNLEILSAVFKEANPEDLKTFINTTPTGKYTRKIWFLYEFLTGNELDIPPSEVSNYEDLLDSSEYFTTKGLLESRQKINNNLLGGKSFCPVVRKSDELKKYVDLNLPAKAEDVVRKYPDEVLQRALSYLYTKETKSSFEIERATPDQKRASKFIALLKLAEEQSFFNKESLIELQQTTVDYRFANNDFRKDQNYVGEAIAFRKEIVHFISPKPEDIPDLMDGMFNCFDLMTQSEVHPVVTAAVSSFGFVFMHPFDDGNGRIHRFLIHNVLAKRHFTPEGLIFPISATLLREMREYDETLELFSKPLLSLLNYEIDDEGKMTVDGETSLHYRYIDMTVIAERLFIFIEKTINEELETEINFIIDYDKAKSGIRDIVDMPDRSIDLIIRFCIENNGSLSNNKRKKHFDMLTAEEIGGIERCIKESFN